MTLSEKLLAGIFALKFAQVLITTLHWAETGLQTRVIQLLEAIEERLSRRDRVLAPEHERSGGS